MTRFHLSYDTKSGRINLYNLDRITANEIKRIQTHLGSTEFELREQPFYFDEITIHNLESGDL